MADLIIPGLPLTLCTFDLRMRADKLLLAGHEEEGRLLHALLDFSAKAHAARQERRDLRDEKQEALDDMKEELRDAETRAEDAEAELSKVQELNREAAERITKALGILSAEVSHTSRAAAYAVLGEALGLLVSRP